MADWVSIRADYVSGGGSFRVLAEKYGISVSSIKKKAASDKWTANRTKVEPKLYQKTVQKVLEHKSEQNADRLTRILALNDTLLQKAALAAEQLDRKMVTHKRKVKTTEKPKDGAWTETTTEEEILAVVDAPLDRQGIKLLASALKDLSDVAVRPASDEQSISKIAELMGRLDKEADDGVSDAEATGVQA